MNFCPCFQKWFKFKSKKEKVSYQGQRQFEEEEFMNPSYRQQSSLVDTISQPSNKKTKITKQQQKPQKKPPIQIEKAQIPPFEQQQNAESDLLNIKMQINQRSKVVQQHEEKDIQELMQQELQMTPKQAVQQQIQHQQQQQQQQRQKQQKPAEYAEYFEQEDTSEHIFTINLDPLDPHFSVLHQKTSKLNDLFTKKGQKLQIALPNKSNLQIQVIDNPKTNNFIINYSLNCSYSYYISLFKNDKLFTQFSPLIAQAKTLQSYKSNLTLNTLKFKRLGGLEARDCFYVKYHNGTRKQHWQIYLNDEKAQRNAAYKTCEVFIAKNIKQKSQRELNVTEYIEIDLQTTNISSLLPKLVAQLRNFYNTVSDYIDRNYQVELV